MVGVAAVAVPRSRWSGGAAWLGLGVGGDVSVRGRRQAASRRSQRLRTQEMGGSRYLKLAMKTTKAT